jgi:predicted dehydrogenase
VLTKKRVAVMIEPHINQQHLARTRYSSVKTIRWGIIGVGDVTEVKSGPGFQEADHSELVAVMRRDRERAQDYADRHHVPRWYDNAQALIQDDTVDAVYIATPPHVHKDYTVMCAEAGKPVLVEKPMALTTDECKVMIEACESHGVPLWVAYYRRALPRFLKIKALLDSGAIGEVRTVSVTLVKRSLPQWDHDWRVSPDISGGGIFVDMGAHTLDFLDYVLGPIQSVQGFATNQAGFYPAEDNVVAHFTFESGVTGVGTWCFTADDEIDRTVLIGTKGRIEFSSFDTEPILFKTANGVQTVMIDNPVHVHQPLIQMVVDALNGTGQCPSTGQSAARTSWVIDQILKSYRQSREQ